MIEIISNLQFLIMVGGPLLVVLLVGGITANRWRKIRCEIDLHWEAFNSPANTAITVAGVAIPLVTGLLTYSFSTLKQTPEQLSPLFVSIVLLGVSILFGLLITFGLATMVGAKVKAGAEATEVKNAPEGTFRITKVSNTYYPAVLVSQLLLLFSAFGLLAYYCLYSLPVFPITNPPSIASMAATVPIMRPHVSVGMTSDEVGRLWGTPQAHEATAQGERLKYQSRNTEYVIQVVRGEVTEVTERKPIEK